MQEMNCIHLSRPDYRAISGSALLPTLAHGATEHNPPMSDNTVGSLVADNHRNQFRWNGLGRKVMGFVGDI
jgi:hypothetical protein